MNVEVEIKRIVFKHFNPQEYKIYLFGSRALGKNEPFSDYDVGILGSNKLSFSKLSKIENDLHDSDIPYKVDIVDLNSVKPKFREEALKGARLWKN